MTRRLIEHDSFTGITEYFHSTDDGFKIETVQDVQPILEANKRIMNDSSSDWKGDWHHIASVPLILVHQWSKELGSDILSKENRKAFIAKLSDYNYSKLRTKGGKL